MINYNNRIKEYNKLKHKLIIKKCHKHSETLNYLCKEDYKYIDNMNKELAKKIWINLCKNLKYNVYSGLHPEGCTFCIESKLLKDKCQHCFWSINHGKCKSLKGIFQIVQKIIKDNQYELITPQEYGDLVKKVIQKEKKILVDK